MVTSCFLIPTIRAVVIPVLISASGHLNQSRSELRERVDLIELNHNYDDLGRHKYDQIIFYEWAPDFKRYHVIAWCLVEGDERRIPMYDSHRDDHVVRWYDRDARLDREVRSRVFRETWSQLDPERENRRWLEEKHRISLRRLPERKVY